MLAKRLNLSFKSWAKRLGGETVSVITQQGERFTLMGLFEAPYSSPDYGHYTLEIRAPELSCLTEAASKLQQGDRVIVEAGHYEVLSTKPDGAGVSHVVLQEVNHD